MRLDTSALDRILRLGGNELLRDLIGLFLEHGGRQFDILMTGLDSEDLEAVESAAHSLVSSAGTLGAADLASVAREIERLARAADIDAVRARRQQVDELFNEATVTLRAKLDVESGAAAQAESNLRSDQESAD